ncbi:MAG: IclR family transcriptional regulator [Acidimicrobiales bacterium]
MTRTTASTAAPAAPEAGSGGTKAIDRALSVLSSFVSYPEQGITDISGRTSLSPSTVHRIVRALVHSGYLEQNDETERYHLGHAAVILGQSARDSLGLERALPILEQLGAVSGESVNMGIRDGNQVVVVLRVESVQPLRFDQPPGSRISMHCSSMGKSLLAFSAEPPPDLDFKQITSTTITSKKELEQQLAQTRELGYSIDDEESIEGVSCVGAPILNAEGNAVAAIAVQAPTVRMTESRRTALAEQAMAAAQEIRSVLRLDTLTALPGLDDYQ